LLKKGLAKAKPFFCDTRFQLVSIKVYASQAIIKQVKTL